MRLNTQLSAGLLLIVLAGCGGGGGSAANGGGTPGGQAGDVTLNIGNFVSRVSGTTQQPISIAGYGATVSGVAGGTVSSLTLSNPPVTPLNSPQVLAQSRILFNRNNEVYVTNASGAAAQPLTGGLAGGNDRPAWSPDGSRVLFSQFDNSVLHSQIYVMNANGMGTARLSDGTADDTLPAWTAAGNKIAFTRYNSSVGHYQIYVMGYNGSGVTRLSDGTTNDYSPAWSPTGDRLVFSHQVGSNNQLYIMNADGTGAHAMTTAYTAYSFQSPAWSADGQKIAFSIGVGTSNYIYAITADGKQIHQVTTGTVSDMYPTWSPDGIRLAFERLPGSGNPQIYSINVDGSGLTALTDGSGVDTYPSWSPYVQSRRLVGSGGILASAAGFLAGQQGDVVSSVVLFNATTPNTAFISTPASLVAGQSSLAVTVTADLLTSLVFTNNFAPVSTILGGTTTATGAVVTFNANTGNVSTVLPFNANKAAVKGGSSERIGDELILRRSFTGVWDAKGKNLAPGGASEVHVSSRTGRLISFR